MRNRIIVGITVAVVSVLVTLVGQFEISQIFQQRLKPVLVKDVLQTDLSNLPPEIQRQLSLIPINYSLKHNVGGTAQNVTVLVKGEIPLSTSDIKFSPESEANQCFLAEPHTLKVNIPTIRPGGLVSFQMFVSVSNKISFSELSENAKIVTTKELEAQKPKTLFIQATIIAGITIFWLALVITMAVVIWRAGKCWQDMETGIAPPELKKRLIALIVALLIYNVVTFSLGPFSAWLPVPRISFSDLTGAFVLYLLVTRYKLIEDWISAKKGSRSAPSEPEKRD